MLKGGAFLALWNDIAPAREAEYDRWHTVEHVPERVAVRGFHAGRRYVNRQRREHRYFTLYDIDDLDVLDSREYQDLVDNPTPWSASMRPDFSNFLRAPCRVLASRGEGIGGAIAVLCFGSGLVPDDEAQHMTQRASETANVVGVHLGAVASAQTHPTWHAPRAASTATRDFDCMVMLEALDHAAAMQALQGFRTWLGITDLPADFGNDVWDVAFVFPGADAAERIAHRRPAWDPRS